MRMRMSKFMRISAGADPDAELRYTSNNKFTFLLNNKFTFLLNNKFIFFNLTQLQLNGLIL